MIAAGYISYKKNFLSKEEYYELRDMFVPFGLPISIDSINVEEIIKLTKSNKKMEENGLKFILLKKIGRAFISTEITEDDLRLGIDEINFKDEDFYE